MTELARDVIATTIPYGEKRTIPKGSNVEITQELGGSYTVLSDLGMMRIEGKDADALGIKLKTDSAGKGSKKAPAKEPKNASEVAKGVWDQLKTCYDPEIPVNIVELGLIYENKVEPTPEGHP